MEPGQVLVSLLYLWLLIALGIYAWRAYRRVVHRETRADRVARRAGQAPGADADRTVSAPAPAVPPPGTPSPTPTPAPTPTPVAEAPAAARPARVTVAESVQGIALPCGLVPVVGDELDPYHVVFATSGHPPAEVGAALATELGRLGYELHHQTNTDSVARRGDTELHVRVGPGSASGAGDPARVIAELST